VSTTTIENVTQPRLSTPVANWTTSWLVLTREETEVVAIGSPSDAGFGGRLAVPEHADALQRLADAWATRYLDFEGASSAVRDAIAEAIESGKPQLAPPPLEDCPDRGTIEQALAAPRAGFWGVEKYRTLPEKAAVLLYTLAKSQACPDGNKRIALILLRSFLYINGTMLQASTDELVDAIIGAAESDREERDRVIAELTDWLQQAIRTT
jgi:death-on-curing protein